MHVGTKCLWRKTKINLPYLEGCLTINWVVAKFQGRQRSPSHPRAPKLPTKSSWGWGEPPPADLRVTPAPWQVEVLMMSMVWGFFTHTL